MFRVGILTVSDKGFRGERQDTTHLAIREVLAGGPLRWRPTSSCPTSPHDQEGPQALGGPGGPGPHPHQRGDGARPRDRTPEATRELLDREVPGLAELMRLVGLRKTPMAALSRGVAGVRGRTLILNLPGSPKGARESLEAVLPVLPHALSLVTGKPWKEGHHE